MINKKFFFVRLALQMINVKASFFCKSFFSFLIFSRAHSLLAKYMLRKPGKPGNLGKQYYNKVSWNKNRLKTSSAYDEWQN